MPVELNDLILKRTRKLDIEGMFAIEWNPSKMTRETYARLQDWHADATKTDPFEAAEFVIAPLMTGWDLSNDGQPYPVTVDNIAALGLDLVVLISRAIEADFVASVDTKKGSAAS